MLANAGYKDKVDTQEVTRLLRSDAKRCQVNVQVSRSMLEEDNDADRLYSYIERDSTMR